VKKIIDFKKKYPVPLIDAIIFPFIYKIWNSQTKLPDVKLKCILDFCMYAGYNEGAVRTAITRLKQKGILSSITDKQKAEYVLSENNSIRTVQIRDNTIRQGFILAIFSFSRENEKERYIIRSILSKTGFRKLAQNTYISIRGRKEELLRKIKDKRLEEHLFIFEGEDDLDKNTVQRLLEIWEINKRQKTLYEFLADLREFLKPGKLSDQEVFQMLGYAGTIFSNRIQRTEPPVPEKYLPEDYPIKNIYNFLIDNNRKFFEATKKYFIKANE
jgi:DNA-binding transcriptional regulator PaaX